MSWWISVCPRSSSFLFGTWLTRLMFGSGIRKRKLALNQKENPQEEREQKNSLWRNRDFHLLWSGQTVSVLGSNVSRLAMPLLVLALTHSPAQAGFMAAVRQAPYLLFSLPAGGGNDCLEPTKNKIFFVFV